MLAAAPLHGVDLLRLRPLRALILWRGFPYVLQAGFLLAAVGMAVVGWGRFAPPGTGARLYAQSNLATLLIWGLWWPATIWTTVLLGRIWCAVCPLELVSNATERIARRSGLAQHDLPRGLATGALAVTLCGLLLFLVAGAQIHRVPAYTSILLLALITAAAVTGLIFRDRAFCRGVCPVSELFATYGRGGMLASRPASGEVCIACSTEECVQRAYRNRSDARSCPSLLNPPTMNDSRDCLLCAQCVKACSRENMRLFLRWPFASVDARQMRASWPTTVLVMLLSGFVIWQLCSGWPAAEKVLLSIPGRATARLGAPSLAGYINGLWALVLVPLFLWLVLGLLVRLFGGAATLGNAWRRLALPVAVIVAAGQMAKALEKFVSWAGFLPHAWRDPAGFGTALQVAPPALLPMSTVSVAGIVLIAIALMLAGWEAKMARFRSSSALGLPLLALAAAFLFLIDGWR